MVEYDPPDVHFECTVDVATSILAVGQELARHVVSLLLITTSPSFSLCCVSVCVDKASLPPCIFSLRSDTFSPMTVVSVHANAHHPFLVERKNLFQESAGFITHLRRTRQGPFRVEKALSVERLSSLEDLEECFLEYGEQFEEMVESIERKRATEAEEQKQREMEEEDKLMESWRRNRLVGAAVFSDGSILCKSLGPCFFRL